MNTDGMGSDDDSLIVRLFRPRGNTGHLYNSILFGLVKKAGVLGFGMGVCHHGIDDMGYRDNHNVQPGRTSGRLCRGDGVRDIRGHSI